MRLPQLPCNLESRGAVCYSQIPYPSIGASTGPSGPIRLLGPRGVRRPTKFYTVQPSPDSVLPPHVHDEVVHDSDSWRFVVEPDSCDHYIRTSSERSQVCNLYALESTTHYLVFLATDFYTGGGTLGNQHPFLQVIEEGGPRSSTTTSAT